MTILILFHLSRYRDLKAFYLQYITYSCRSEFPHLVSYNRFVELQSRVGFKLIAFLNMCCLGQCTGISFIDSTPLKACHIKRAHGHRTMRGWAQKGKSTMGWFYGFKLHIVINDRGEIINYQITPGNCDDREPLKDGTFTKNLFGKLIVSGILAMFFFHFFVNLLNNCVISSEINVLKITPAPLKYKM